MHACARARVCMCVREEILTRVSNNNNKKKKKKKKKNILLLKLEELILKNYLVVLFDKSHI